MDSQAANTNMVLQQIKPWDVLNQDLLELIHKIPRADFFSNDFHELAYADTEIPIGSGEYSFSPKLEARILQALDIQKTDSVLEVGTGCGYLTALLCCLSKQVVSYDIHEKFTEQTRKALKTYKIYNAALVTDNYFAAQQNTYFDVVVMGGGLSTEADLPLSRLKDNGKLFCFLGEHPCLQAVLFTRQNNNYLKQVLFETYVNGLHLNQNNKRFIF